MVEAHDVADLDAPAVVVPARDEQPVAARAEGRVHRGALAALDGEEVFPDQRAGAEDAQAVQRQAEDCSGGGAPERLAE